MAKEKQSIDLGLAVLATVTERGVEWSVADLAEICGVSERAIRDIEQKALAKMRRVMGKEKLNGDEVEIGI